jgi:hypothetical protein
MKGLPAHNLCQRCHLSDSRRTVSAAESTRDTVVAGGAIARLRNGSALRGWHICIDPLRAQCTAGEKAATDPCVVVTQRTDRKFP